jgi:hypothetical protein
MSHLLHIQVFGHDRNCCDIVIVSVNSFESIDFASVLKSDVSHVNKCSCTWSPYGKDNGIAVTIDPSHVTDTQYRGSE